MDSECRTGTMPNASRAPAVTRRQAAALTTTFRIRKANTIKITGLTKDTVAMPLVGQWIDITGVPEGEYIARVSLNQAPIFNEGENRYSNVTQVTVYVPNPRKKVTVVE